MRLICDAELGFFVVYITTNLSSFVCRYREFLGFTLMPTPNGYAYLVRVLATGDSIVEYTFHAGRSETEVLGAFLCDLVAGRTPDRVG
jgi:hypothetical protein